MASKVTPDDDVDALGLRATAEPAHGTDPHGATFQTGDGPAHRAPLLGNRYELLALLGAGGMGNVYKARDRELDELVALKVLRPEIAGAPGALERFRREIKLARRVTHPNVARVFDLGEHGGDRILTMELVVGESLATLLERERVLPASRALEIATQVCAGVAAAHEAGVIHRDLKPDNILLGVDGRVVVTDFGIARALEREDANLTGAGYVGTPAYIAPEQVETPLQVDHRVDVYALGEIVYEMIAGERAWQGQTVLAVVARRLSSPPPDARAKRADADPQLAALAQRCMARNPDERFASMSELSDTLRTLAQQPSAERTRSPRRTARVLSPDPRAGHKRVAVLPFRNAGQEADGYLADGLTEDLIDLLTAADGLRVTSRGVVMRHKGTDHDPRDVGRELGVQVVVDCTVRRAAGSVRVTARLISVEDGFQLWARRFDGADADVLTLCEQVAKAVAAALTVDITGPARGAVADPEALDLYLQARSAYLGYYGAGRDIALDLFARALARAPDDPRVIAGYVMVNAYSMSDASRAAELRALADRALVLAPSFPDTHVALAAVLFQENEHVAAVRPLVRALRLASNHAEAHDLLGRLLLEADAPEGVRHAETALVLEPAIGLPRGALARHFWLRGERERAESLIEGAHDPKAAIGMSCRFAMWHRDIEKTRALLEHFPPGSQGVNADIRRILEVVTTGTFDADVPFAAVDRGAARARAFGAQIEAEIQCTLAQPERALRGLERCDAERLGDVAWLDHCPALAPLRGSAELARIREPIAARAAAVRAAYAAELAASSA